MNWRVYQRIFELTAVLAMVTGIFLMWLHKDPRHFLVYGGFALLSTGKLIEAVNLDDPTFKILKIATCICIYVLVIYSLAFNIRTMVYILIPLGTYYALHYRLVNQHRRT